jgi:MFS family permease
MRGNGLDTSPAHWRPRAAVNGATVPARRDDASASQPHPLRKPPAEPCEANRTTSLARAVLLVLLPFAAGYYLSYLYRSINALIAGDLVAELGLGAADLGLLTSMYFLTFAAVQLPCGVLLDRYGPRLIDSALLLVAAAGSLLFALADDVATLLVGRALIGLGVAVGLMAGLKAIVLWFPPERVALANGWYIMLGALGALSATGPAEAVVQVLGWRGLFAALAVASAAVALTILLVVPERKSQTQTAASPRIGFLAIYLDPRFLRIAPQAALVL